MPAISTFSTAFMPTASPASASAPPYVLGDTFYVDSGHPNAADAAGAGLSKEWPCATIDYATGLCTSEAGDLVVVHPRHVETVIAASGLLLDVAGVWYWCPPGPRKATISFGTAVGANCALSAAHVTMDNFLFTGDVDLLTGPIDISAADIQLRNIETMDVTGQATDWIVTTAAADRLLVDGWVHRGAAAAGTDTAISIVGGDGITVRNFWIDGNFAVAAIENVTTQATNLTIGGGMKYNYIRNRHASCVLVTLKSDSTGNIGPGIYGRLLTDAANITASLVGAAAQFYGPLLIVNANNEQGFAWNGTTSAHAIV